MSLGVATYNVYLGADLLKILAATSPEELHSLAAQVFADVGATDFPQRARGIVAELEAAGWPDLVGAQEVACWSTGTPGSEPEVWCDFSAELVAAFAEAGAPYDVVASAPNFGGRMPISASTYVDLRAYNVTFVRRDTVQVTEVREGSFSARLELPTEMDGVSFDVIRSWTVASLAVDGGAVEFANTHLETYDPDIRRSQLQELFDLLGPGPAVVVGDLNEDPPDLRIPQDWSDAWIEAAHDRSGGETCEEVDPLLRNPERRFDRRIDYVLTRGVPVRSCRLVGDQRPLPSGLWPSDHAGVVAELGAATSRGPGSAQAPSPR